MEDTEHPSDITDISTHLEGSGDAGMSTMNLYATLGLCPEDVDALAQIPESEISVETLPFLIMQLKAKRAQEQEQQRETSPERDREEEGDTDAREHQKEDSPTVIGPRRSNSHGDADYRRVVSYKRLDRPEKMEGKREYRHARLSRDKMPDSRPRFPLSYQVDDFHGAMPKEFPHTCSLCFCQTNSKTTWASHLKGMRHAEGKRELMRLYPDWERRETSRKMPSKDDSSPPRRAPRPPMPYKRPRSPERDPGVWYRQYKPKAGTKVVVTRFIPGGLQVEDLLALAEPYGTVVKHLVLMYKGFLEFSTEEEAADMVNHYTRGAKPVYVRNHKVTMYLSPTVCHINVKAHPSLAELRVSRFVCFNPLPPGKLIESEVLDLAKMFGHVRHSNFLGDQALIEMVSVNDAKIMVKYYLSNPLKIGGKSVKVSFSSPRRNRESPESSTSRRADSSKSHSSRHKSEEAANTSSNIEKSKADMQSAEETGENEDSHQSASGNREEEDLDSENKELEEEEGIEVEDEQSLLDDVDVETGANVDAEKPTGSPVADVKDETELGSAELSAEEKLVDSDQKAADDPALCDPDQKTADDPPVCDPDASMEDLMEQESFHEDDEHMDDMDFPENMDDFVTLDELDDKAEEGDASMDSAETQDGRVVIIKPIRRAYQPKVMQAALYKLAEPFGKVVHHILSYYRQEARLELESSEKAHEMVKALRDHRKSQLFGKHVSVTMSHRVKYLEMPSGRSIFIGMLPYQKYSDISLLRLALPFGKITGYNLNWRNRTCYIQMETVEAAQKMLRRYEWHGPRFHGSVLKIAVCQKGDSLITWYPPVRLERWLALKVNGPPAKSPSAQMVPTGEDGPLPDSEGVCGDPDADKVSAAAADPEGEDKKPEEPLGPYKPDNPVGLHYLVQRTGLFCRLCNIFYTNEKTAKTVHCSSEEHYENVKRKMEEEKQPSAD